jgi:hypothetical protein
LRLARLERAFRVAPLLPPPEEFGRLPPALQRHYLLTRLPPALQGHWAVTPLPPGACPEEWAAALRAMADEAAAAAGVPAGEEALRRLGRELGPELAAELRPWVDVLPPAEREKLARQARLLPLRQQWRLPALAGEGPSAAEEAVGPGAGATGAGGPPARPPCGLKELPPPPPGGEDEWEWVDDGPGTEGVSDVATEAEEGGAAR